MLHVWGKGEVSRVWVGKREGRRPLGRPRRRRKKNIKMVPSSGEIGRGMDWIDLAQDRDGGLL
jgi:hypothetical protein